MGWGSDNWLELSWIWKHPGVHFYLRLQNQQVPFSGLGKGEQCKGINWHSYIWTWSKGHIPWQLGRGEFSSCKAYGGFNSSPQWKCVILCAQTITSSLAFLENIYFWWELPIYYLSISPHRWTHDQYEPIRIFLQISHKIWRERASLPLRSLDYKNIGYWIPGVSWSPSAGENKAKTREKQKWEMMREPWFAW